MDNDYKFGQWIPCSDGLPDPEEEVEITYIDTNYKTGADMYLTARAIYEDGKMTTEDSDFIWDEKDNFEYDEDKDCYIIPEGWWEAVSFAETFDPVDKKVIAWMPPPDPYVPIALDDETIARKAWWPEWDEWRVLHAKYGTGSKK